ncbi:elongation factor P hydroxylase [Thalassotalea sp. PLHSN55]|uniref:elongation factor P hydroxylase n=1 Tax=Thalassotalea sp. PLHSN55 TaxID=3435888 RepID=UPI003F843BD2
MSSELLTHRYQDLIELFKQTFFQQYNTQLIKGGDEPLYLPANEHCSYHQIIFAHGYFSSALHEIAHWCIAGKERRLLEDFGYWYIPDGRNAKQQHKFEQVEIAPQAIEWAFNIACNKKFNVSADNLNGAGADTITFKKNVHQQALAYLQQGFPKRAQLFINTLANFYQTTPVLCAEQFELEPAALENYYE